MIPKGNAFLPTVSLERLQRMARSERERKPQLRLLAAVHRKQGWKLERIAAALAQPLTTIHDWLLRFHKHSLDRIKDKKQPGRPPELTLKQRRRLVKELEHGPPNNKNGLWTTKQVKDVLKHKYGVEFVNQHVWRLLTTLGFSLLRPRKRHYQRPSDEELERFKKKLSDKQDIIGEKGLLWAHRMKQHSALSRSSSVDGQGGEAALLLK